MRNLTKLSIGAASLITLVGVSFADVPQQNLGAGNDFDNYTVDASGNIIYNVATEGSGTGTNCPNNATCTVLEATGEGILQQQVKYDGDGTFFQTIIVDDGVANVANVGTDPSVTFRMENYVQSGNSGPQADLATLSVVKGGSVPGLDAFVSEFEGAEGTLVGADATTGTGFQAAERIHQFNQLGATSRLQNFDYEDNGPGGKRMSIEMQNPNNEGQFTLRRVAGNYVQAAGNLTLLSGDTTPYVAGDAIQVVYVTQAASGTGPQNERLVGITIASVLADNEGLTVEVPPASGNFTDVLAQISQDNFDDSNFAKTSGVVLGAAGTQATGAGPFLTPWNAVFGAAPLTYDSNGAGGTTAPAGGFWPTPPPYFQIVP
jgi:acid stress-induced BolA-like protein IbaG/YrbA